MEQPNPFLQIVFGGITQLLSQPYFYILFALGIAVLFFKSAFFKGKFGEFMVNLAARFALDKDTYRLIKNVTLPTEDGSTTQIDHVFVSRYGLFVVETKNMNGWIFGSERQKQWTQKIYKQSYKFQNPLHQNYKHVKTLESFLGVPEDKIFSVIVFVGDSTFKTDMPENVTYTSGYIDYIKSKTEEIFSEDEVWDIYLSISTGRLEPSLATERGHVDYLRSKHSSN